MNKNTHNFDYSVIIRTLGTSGEKYVECLKSIQKQSIQPQEIVVVMAKGYTEPSYHIDKERIIWTRKGMINQRQVGFEESISPFLLVLDDDVAFDPDFVERMYLRMIETFADCIFPYNISDNIKEKRLIQIKNFVLAQKRYSSKQNPYYQRIGITGGTIVNTSIKPEEYHWCQTANFACFFIKRNVALEVHLEDEMWLEDTGYAWPDDQVFFYKAYLKGYKTLMTPDIYYKHLDAKSGNINVDKTYKDTFIYERNITIFWYRFIWLSSHNIIERIFKLLGIGYKIMAMSISHVIKCIIRKKFSIIHKCFDGFIEALKFIYNQKYDT